MKLQWNQPKKFSNSWNTKQKEEQREEKREKGNKIRHP